MHTGSITAPPPDGRRDGTVNPSSGGADMSLPPARFKHADSLAASKTFPASGIIVAGKHFAENLGNGKRWVVRLGSERTFGWRGYDDLQLCLRTASDGRPSHHRHHVMRGTPITQFQPKTLNESCYITLVVLRCLMQASRGPTPSSCRTLRRDF
ncbi:hypothetical protein E2C01_005207 [Portunus trituberculatus]|uniref:Uncharacterized protein n=1 Tax=Portunus trituberculatus TaxID=210409 RepID=A0A5B7CTM9_PORTR|nr:hypothetical protein [Portunus trituberculatus]